MARLKSSLLLLAAVLLSVAFGAAGSTVPRQDVGINLSSLKRLLDLQQDDSTSPRSEGRELELHGGHPESSVTNKGKPTMPRARKRVFARVRVSTIQRGHSLAVRAACKAASGTIRLKWYQ